MFKKHARPFNVGEGRHIQIPVRFGVLFTDNCGLTCRDNLMFSEHFPIRMFLRARFTHIPWAIIAVEFSLNIYFVPQTRITSLILFLTTILHHLHVFQHIFVVGQRRRTLARNLYRLSTKWTLHISAK